MLTRIKHYYNRRQLLRSFVARDLKSRYMGSVMGLFWSVLDPLVTLVVFTFVFSVILKIRFGTEAGVGNFALYLFCGLLPWIAFSESVQRSMGVLLENANLIKKMVFPLRILPTYVIISAFISQLIGMVILVAAILLYGYTLSLHILFLPVIFALQLTFTAGFCFALASINVFIRDTAHLMAKILMAWMYLTPIIYPLTIVPEKARPFFMINPFAHIVAAYRDVILNNRLPDLHGLVFLLVFSLVVFKVGHEIFNRTKHKFADVI
jgi:ABC-type polysaccharide/polyol phosphate export permease